MRMLRFLIEEKKATQWLVPSSGSTATSGYGFIAPDDGSADVFAHFSAINSTGFRSLNEGDKVFYEVQQGPKGLQAANITVVR